MKAAILSSLANRALKFASDKGLEDLGVRALLEIKQNKLYITTCNGNDGIVIWSDYIGDPLTCVVHAAAFTRVVEAFDDDDQLVLKIKDNKLIVKGRVSSKLPIYDNDAIYNMPLPKQSDWIESSDPDLSDTIERVVSISTRDPSSFQKTPPNVILDENNVCQISRSLSVIEKNN